MTLFISSIPLRMIVSMGMDNAIEASSDRGCFKSIRQTTADSLVCALSLAKEIRISFAGRTKASRKAHLGGGLSRYCKDSPSRMIARICLVAEMESMFPIPLLAALSKSLRTRLRPSPGLEDNEAMK